MCTEASLKSHFQEQGPQQLTPSPGHLPSENNLLPFSGYKYRAGALGPWGRRCGSPGGQRQAPARLARSHLPREMPVGVRVHSRGPEGRKRACAVAAQRALLIGSTMVSAWAAERPFSKRDTGHHPETLSGVTTGERLPLSAYNAQDGPHGKEQSCPRHQSCQGRNLAGGSCGARLPRMGQAA